MNVLGIGVDIVEVDRFRRDRPDMGLLSKFLSEEELREVLGKKDPAPTLAGRFAAKEAIIKAATTALPGKNVFYHDIRVGTDRSGAPSASIMKEGCDKVQIFLSISHGREQAIAFALIVDGG